MGRFEQWSSRALDHFNRGAWPSGERAVQLYSEDLIANPNDAEARKLRGEALAGLGRHDEAIHDFTAALAQWSGDIELLTAAARSFEQLGRHREAITAFDSALRQTPRDVSLLLGRSASHFAVGEITEAADDLLRAVPLEPIRPGIFNDMAWYLVSKPVASRDAQRALALAQAAAAAAADDEGVVNTLGAAQYRAGLWKDAVKTLTSIGKGTRPTTGFDQVFLAMAYQKLGRTRDAENMLQATRQSIDELRASLPKDAEHLRALLREAEALGRDSEFPANPFAGIGR
jgi:tetratricopeptide (TPR) repeat protein